VRLYFNLVNGSETLRDKEGIELRSRRNTLRSLQGYQRSVGREHQRPEGLAGVADEGRRGSVVLSIPLSTVLCD